MFEARVPIARTTKHIHLLLAKCSADRFRWCYVTRARIVVRRLVVAGQDRVDVGPIVVAQGRSVSI